MLSSSFLLKNVVTNSVIYYIVNHSQRECDSSALSEEEKNCYSFRLGFTVLRNSNF